MGFRGSGFRSQGLGFEEIAFRSISPMFQDVEFLHLQLIEQFMRGLAIL